MQALRSDDEIRTVNTRYHDVAADSYDAKWGIDFGEIGQAQVLGKLGKLLDERAQAGLGRSLEIGAGTGYFSLNLLQTGVVCEATCTDISPGMLEALSRNAQRLGLEVRTVVAEAGALPFADASFDLVLGHAVLHHLPDLERAFEQLHRVLAPGGRILFAGEPSRLGDRVAALPKWTARALAPAWRRALHARRAPAPSAAGGSAAHPSGHGANGDAELALDDDHELESLVDIHAFRPSDLIGLATRAGLEDVRVRGEELTANWFGWFNRGLEATAVPADVPMLWRRYAFRGYLLLQRLDGALLEPILPPAIFYNLLLTAKRPG
ncbi:MAG: class I SAM-dependent methyltransferase [Solirubrobacteraceae bacterium]